MPVKKDPTGRRSVQAEVEVPGTPEQVWNAIATGPGITSWFVPTRLEQQVGGKIECSFGPQMDSVTQVKDWDPPRRFTAVDSEETGPNGPSVATEWVVEARGGGTCVVRVVHSWFADNDDWDNQFEGHSQGWIAFFRTLRLYLTHFPGQHASCMQQLIPVALPPNKAFAALTNALGISQPSIGKQITRRDTPVLEGMIEQVGPDAHPELTIRLSAPAPGIAHMFALPMGPQTFICVRLYLFGAHNRNSAAEQERTWQSFLQTKLISPQQ